MTRTCVSCGTRALEGAIFCNRCGARLPPADLLTCPRCGKTSPDRKSRFCDRCGSPLGFGGNVIPSPKTPAPRGMTCPACGFENSGGNRFYCQSCGAYLPKREAVPQHIAGEAEVPAPSRGGIRIIPDGMDELRQSTSSVRSVRPVIPRTRQPVQPGPVAAPAAPPEPPRKRRREAPKEGPVKPDRRVMYGAAAVIILIVIIAAYILSASGGGTTDAQVPAPGSGDSSDSGLFESFLAAIMPNQTSVSTAKIPAINRAVPVFTNTPPKRLTYQLPDPDSY